MPTSLLASNSYQRQPKQHQHILADGNMNKAQITQSRKRKANDSGLEDGCMPAKSKIVPHSESRFQLSIYIYIRKLFYLTPCIARHYYVYLIYALDLLLHVAIPPIHSPIHLLIQY